MNILFSNFPKEKIKLVKTTGVTIDNIEAIYTKDRFLIDDCTLDIEENDIVVRFLSNGKTEQYLILDRGYHRGMGIIPEHYHLTVQKIIDNVIPHKESSKKSFSTESERLEAVLLAADSFLNDLVFVGQRLCTNAAYNENTDEDTINDYLRDMLCSKGYDETKDQTRHGISYNGKSAGEVDILITKEGDEIALIEGLKLNCVDTANIDKHIDKAINNYNALGTATFIVTYVSATDFGAFWEKYFDYISNYPYDMEVKRAMEQLTAPNASIRIAQIIISKNDFDFPVYFICFNIKN